MSNLSLLTGLAVNFGLLSLQAVGGGAAVIPEMQTLVDQTYHISSPDFAHYYSLGQLAPGPNMLMVLLLGERIAGFSGSLVALLAFLVPATVLCFYAGRLWNKAGDSPWRRAVQDGLAPISIGLMASGVYSIGKSSATTWVTLALAFAILALMLRTKINPSLLILFSGICGVFFLPHT